eukprot:Pompholyxophrys_punicea_v1_NODE_1278_length_819_cov_6.801047.p1 type:complete len:176 gc:universal NODE_1278_length_819_cov_6.801047:156-683(+)
MVATRPDISYAVSCVSRHLDDFTEENWQAVKRILRYLKGTKRFGHSLFDSQDNPLVAYADSNHAADKLTARSTSGMAIYFSQGPISWKSCLQATVATSSAEAEYVAPCTCAQEAKFLQQLLGELKESGSSNPITIYQDNTSTISMATSPGSIQRTRHINIKYHFIREMIELLNKA